MSDYRTYPTRYIHGQIKATWPHEQYDIFVSGELMQASYLNAEGNQQTFSDIITQQTDGNGPYYFTSQPFSVSDVGKLNTLSIAGVVSGWIMQKFRGKPRNSDDEEITIYTLRHMQAPYPVWTGTNLADVVSLARTALEANGVVFDKEQSK